MNIDLQLNYNSGNGIVYVTLIGALCNNNIEAITKDIIQYVREYGSHKVIIDHTAIKFDFRFIDIYRIPELYDAMGISRNVKSVLVVGHKHHDKQKFDFYTSVCMKHGIQISIARKVNYAERLLLRDQALA